MMKKIAVILFILFLYFITNAFTFKGDSSLIATDTYKGYTLFIYKQKSAHCPYLIKISNIKFSGKEMMIIDNNDDLFKYILVEKTDKDMLYYPFAWQDLKSISLSDIKENCRKVLDKQVNPVDKKPLTN